MRCSLALIAIATGIACAPVPDGRQVPLEALALYSGGSITVTEVDHIVLELSPGQRLPPPGRDPADWVGDLAERALEKEVLATPEALAALEDEDSFREQWRVQSRGLLANLLTRTELAKRRVTDKELRGYYESRRELLTSPERRAVHNMLIPYDGSEEKSCGTAQELRKRVRNGASFFELARQYSESSTAADGGFVGLVGKADLRRDLSAVIFGLATGEVSEVVPGPTGCQIFFVQEIVPPIIPTFRNSYSRVLESYRALRRYEFQQRVLAEEFASLSLDRPSGLEATDFDLNRTYFDAEGETVTGAAVQILARPGMSLAAIVDQLVGELLLARVMLREHPEAAEVALGEARERLTHRLLQQRHRRAFAASIDDDELRGYYGRYPERFSSEPRVELSLLVWELGPGDPTRQARVAMEAVVQLRTGATPEEVRDGLAPESRDAIEVEYLPLTNLRQLAAEPRFATLLNRSIDGSQVLGPSRSGDKLYVARVETLVPARRLGFLEVRSRVRADLARTQRERLERRRLDRLKMEYGYRALEERLDSYGATLFRGLIDGSIAPDPRGYGEVLAQTR